MMLKTVGLYGIFVINAIRAFSVTPFSRVLRLLDFLLRPRKVVETLPIHQNMLNSHIYIQLMNMKQHIYLRMLIFRNMAEKRFLA